MARQLSTSDILPRVTVLHNGVLNLHVLIVEYYVGLKDYPVSRNVYFYAYVSRLPLVNVVDQWAGLCAIQILLGRVSDPPLGGVLYARGYYSEGGSYMPD